MKQSHKGKFSIVQTLSLSDMSPVLVNVEIYLRRGIPGYQVIGLPTTTMRESRDRVRAAIENSGFEFPLQNITINLSPTGIPKKGSHFDLSFAVGILLASNQISLEISEHPLLLLGELGLDGSIKPIQDASRLLACNLSDELSTIVLPTENLEQCRIFWKGKVKPIESLSQINLDDSALNSQLANPKFESVKSVKSNPINQNMNLESLGFIDLYAGQRFAFEALEIALAGNHHMLMIGSPGSGKSMLGEIASSLQSVPNLAEWKEIAAIQSQEFYGSGNQWMRPFRNPHHSITMSSLIGGGSTLERGEISLAHNGILFLDEIGEMKSSILQNLREPLEKGNITLNRNTKWSSLPCRFQLIAASNLCPCGEFSIAEGSCGCRKDQIRGYLSKLTGPLLDRIDIISEVYAPSKYPGNSIRIDLNEVRSRIQNVRCIQWKRYQNSNIRSNASMTYNEAIEQTRWDKHAIIAWENFASKEAMSIREREKILGLARTIADLKCNDLVTEADICLACSLRDGSKNIKKLAA
ncbi:YifB family Mg chelatase-like AAA ATPase [Leptospira sp. GIMC2001]|uniref:YifB family Mg chelatase-like AAA ATPase n=1 Tax=Leptospira sp. GIMC2001 TaxID=1513297 RepID=UPI00234AB1F9|nr:YifB family Mg chelatase-like AAA ATPase [Leptospira sp. GIMC2001]WCL47931.1 YifB family Mg chelatase-like AAA ATPase [Leptospira sp. GIMC2001]